MITRHHQTQGLQRYIIVLLLCVTLGMMNVMMMMVVTTVAAAESSSSSSSQSITNDSLVCTKNGRKCDTHIRCPIWKEDGECIRSSTYMNKVCPGSCENVKQTMIQESTIDLQNGNCIDRHHHCPEWAKLGECTSNQQHMSLYCAVSCKICEVEPASQDTENDPSCINEHENCDFWAKAGECDVNPNYMKHSCRKACQTCHGSNVVQQQSVSSSSTQRNEVSITSEIQNQTSTFGMIQRIEGAQQQEVYELVEKSVQYMSSDEVLQLDASIREKCQNRHDLCAFWATIGECTNNAAYMKTNCAPSCMTCHLIDIHQRCPKLSSNAVTPALYPGQLNLMFERMIRNTPGNRTDLSDDERQEYIASITPIYTIHVHSRPEPNMTETTAAIDQSTPPWVITFDNFLTNEECDTLIQLGYQYKYEISKDVGNEKFDGSHEAIQSERRTSKNAWCSSREGCRSEKVPTRIHERIASVLHIPAVNSEDFQLLKYEIGQFYRTHHDYIPHQEERQCGPRILTFFLYLSDVMEGGGTNFPQLDITIEPKRGRALVWPSVYNHNPMKKDPRMMHQALEVLNGTKYAANGWIHMYDYVTPQANGCT